MARLLTHADLITAVQQPLRPPSAPSAPPSARPTPAQAQADAASADFCMGQVAAVVSLSRTNKLNYREAVKQIETIVHNYEQNQ